MAVYPARRMGMSCINTLVRHLTIYTFGNFLLSTKHYAWLDKNKQDKTLFSELIDTDNCIMANLYEKSYTNIKITFLLQ